MKMRMSGTKKAHNPMQTTIRLLSYITKTHKIQLILVIIGILISSIVGVIGSLFLQTLIDDYIIPLIAVNNPDFSGLLNAILKMGCIYYAGVISTYTYNRLMVTITQAVQKEIRDEMFAHMQTLPIKYFDTHSYGDTMSYYTNDIDTLRQMLSQGIPQTFSSLVTIISVLISMLYVSIPLTAVVLCTSGISLFVSKSIAGNSAKYFVKQQKAIGNVNGYIEEMISGQKVVKVFCHEKETIEAFDVYNESLCETATLANKFSNVLGPVLNNLGHLQYVIIAIVGGVLAINGLGGLTLGAIATFLQLSRSFNQPINQVSQQFNAIVMALAGAERIFGLIDEESEIDEGDITLVNVDLQDGKVNVKEHRTGVWAWQIPANENGGYTYVPLKGDVRFYDVNFGYSDDKIVLHDVSLFAKPGEKLAFVGATGAGKTTITNLINRFYDIQEGRIEYDGLAIKRIKKKDLRKSLGIVLQDTNLFTGTIRDNIRYGKLNATDEEIYNAAKLANADGFIQMLQEGYDTVLEGDGSGLSQGQRQLLSIARAAIANPPVMILDEATSSIDTRTEAIVQEGMDSLMKGRTVFVIAHRLSTVRNSDAIMVLDFGRIIERGNHNQLIREMGRYYQLYTGAFELE